MARAASITPRRAVRFPAIRRRLALATPRLYKCALLRRVARRWEWHCCVASSACATSPRQVLGQLTDPIVLPIADRLVLSPHVYGHDLSMQYMTWEQFPSNMPYVWDRQ